MENKLPVKLEDVKLDDLDKFEFNDEQRLELQNYLLNKRPPESWLKKHYSGFQYLPIDKVEFLLTKLFKQWHVEVLEVGQLMNAAYCRIRLYYGDKGQFQDGVGAASFQVDKGSKASDMTAIKQSAVEMAIPKAKTTAVKDAADCIGRIFGRDVQRKGTLDYKLDTEKFKNLL